MAAAAGAFALAPALANAGVLNYANANDRKLYFKGVQPLLEDKFDLSADTLQTFLLQVDDRVTENGWDAIISIPNGQNDAAGNPILIILTTDYGRITLDQIDAHVQTYHNAPNRDCQNSFMLYNCLMSSLTNEAQATVRLDTSQFTRDGVGVGALLLKTIINRSYVDTRATTMQIRDNLAALDTYMPQVDSNIDQFNNYVKVQIQGLTARGEESLDLLSNLFKGYAAASDREFTDFIKRKKDEYEEGDLNLTPTSLMDKASNKYNALVTAQRWNKPSEEQEEIIALKAEISTIRTRLRRPATSKEKDDKGPTKPVWLKKNEPPEHDTGKTSKSWNGRTYYWCKFHERWSVNAKHTTDTCEQRGMQKPKVKKDKPREDAVPENPTMHLNAAIGKLEEELQQEEKQE